ncbi:hypothetical protein QM012_004284 [Aureobasidium pullulans]|uniref:Aminoglycoside phosphotransferase domain-containing protein n=1 Tax=Aureobasidium pullulans TaxID=5580 RepID=A0ABR0TSP0_AURPU
MAKTSYVESSDSLRSSTPDSTSTYQHCHEPFETFRNKVGLLARDIGADTIDNIVRLPGGGLNRLIAADLYCHNPSSTLEKVVLRIPRYSEDEDEPNKDIRDQVSILRFLGSCNVPVPRVLAYDGTSNNPLGMPFSMQTRVVGQGLVFGDMDITGRLGLASELVRILAAFEDVKFQTSGRLSCSETVPARRTIDNQDDSRLSENILVEEFGVDNGSYRSKTRIATSSSLQELISIQLLAWLQYESLNDHGALVPEMFKRLQGILGEMTELGFFQKRATLNCNILHHWELEPRNIMIGATTTSLSDTLEASHYHITGVLDWKGAMSVPAVLARKPPVWLWQFHYDDNLPSSILEQYDGDADLLPPELYCKAGGRLSPEDLQVKHFFESEITSKLYGDSSAASREAYLDDAATGPEDNDEYLIGNGLDDSDHDLPVPCVTRLMQPGNTQGPAQDVFNRATLLYTLMNDGKEPLNALRESEGSTAVTHAVKARKFPAMASDLLGDFVAKAWRGGYQDAQALYAEVQAWLEGKSYTIELETSLAWTCLGYNGANS